MASFPQSQLNASAVQWPAFGRNSLAERGASCVLDGRTDLRRVSPSGDVSLARALAAVKRFLSERDEGLAWQPSLGSVRERWEAPAEPEPEPAQVSRIEVLFGGSRDTSFDPYRRKSVWGSWQ